MKKGAQTKKRRWSHNSRSIGETERLDRAEHSGIEIQTVSLGGNSFLNIATTGTVVLNNFVMSQGVQHFHMVGEEIYTKRLSLRYIIKLSAATDTDAASDVVRVLLLRDKQYRTPITTGNSVDLFTPMDSGNPNIHSQVREWERRRFDILYDKWHDIHATAAEQFEIAEVMVPHSLESMTHGQCHRTIDDHMILEFDDVTGNWFSKNIGYQLWCFKTNDQTTTSVRASFHISYVNPYDLKSAIDPIVK